MGAKLSTHSACAIADASLEVPLFHSFTHLRVARYALEQEFRRANDVTDDAFFASHPVGGRRVELVLEGMSDDSAAEGVLIDAAFAGATCLIRFDTAQGKRVEGAFRISKLEQEASGREFEAIRVELRSEGTIFI